MTESIGIIGAGIVGIAIARALSTASIPWPGAGALARKHWRMGAKEIAASLVEPLYFQQARRFIPELQMDDLTAKTAAGVGPRHGPWTAAFSMTSRSR